MEYLKIIIPIFVGALIGYCTNYIAIKMLFKPQKPIYVFGKKLPFTPGVIPKNKSRIAAAVGKAVGQNLFTNQDIVNAITESGLKNNLSEKIMDTAFNTDSSIKDYIDKYYSKKSGENDDLIQTELSKEVDYDASDYDDVIIEETDYDKIKNKVSDVITLKILGAFEKIDLNAMVSQIASKTLSEKVKGTMMEMFLNESTVSAMSAPIGNSIAEYIKNHGEEIIYPLVDTEVDSFMEKPVSENLEELGLDTNILESSVNKLFDTAVSKCGSMISEYIDIPGIVESKINKMDVSELEELVMQVMKNELQTVINLGALIGAVIGIINIFW
ncbi:MAG: DUF445 family protein [Clostridium sp.]|uniref:DUF445 domain-containing protein n=1 Tax=Butyribacter sp. TaxID=2822465 RepID=UPI002A925E16|nr:DUF445 family protein [Clostridium sp.]MDY5179858.1 DUF445 family protein [Butyribacter sp.]